MRNPASREVERSLAIGRARREARSQLFHGILRALRNLLNAGHSH